jgi:Spy/CpxP family protein refolding chaperone
MWENAFEKPWRNAMKSIRIAVASAVLGLAGFVAATVPFATVDAQDASSDSPPPPGAGHGWGHHHGFGPLRALHKLGLSDEQKASIKTIMQSAGPSLKSLHEQIRANQQQLRATTPDSANYASVLASVSQTAGTLETQKVTQEAKLYAQIYAVLTAEQKTQLATLQAKWAAHAPPDAPAL